MDILQEIYLLEKEVERKWRNDDCIKGAQEFAKLLTTKVKNCNIPDVVVSLICDHPKDEREDYHDCSVVCNKCGCVIEQYGKEINPPSPL